MRGIAKKLCAKSILSVTRKTYQQVPGRGIESPHLENQNKLYWSTISVRSKFLWISKRPWLLTSPRAARERGAPRWLWPSWFFASHNSTDSAMWTRFIDAFVPTYHRTKKSLCCGLQKNRELNSSLFLVWRVMLCVCCTINPSRKRIFNWISVKSPTNWLKVWVSGRPSHNAAITSRYWISLFSLKQLLSLYPR